MDRNNAMLTIFCLRLACGLLGSLVLFRPELVNPRFYRVHFLTALGLTAGAVFVGRDAFGPWLAGAAAVFLLAFAGSVVWSLDGAPWGKTLIGMTLGALAITLVSASFTRQKEAGTGQTAPRALLWVATWANDFTSAALLGTATTAMLMGHSYLIAPSMALTPLRRLMAGLFVALFLRLALALISVASWTIDNSPANLESETVLWLPLRWGVGLVAPLILGWMAWESVQIRSTQSATGILYVVVIFCVLGELTSQLLQANTGYIL